ncbi:hypothetical protein ACIPYS_27585 [Kitasatospora sp. NPDC089913]|uniref:hypothetical protein n=1 Tax=Kitasatospora sp. NPDC089913 TaxID=3364080 RepID=UPI00381C7AA6
MSESMARPSTLLDPSETALLARSLVEWIGPARCSDQLAVGMGFADFRDLIDRTHGLARALRDDLPIAPVDRARILLSAEIVFVSDLAGSGVDWSTTTGFLDGETLTTLRSVQRELGRTVRSYYGRTPSA